MNAFDTVALSKLHAIPIHSHRRLDRDYASSSFPLSRGPSFSCPLDAASPRGAKEGKGEGMLRNRGIYASCSSGRATRAAP